MSSNQSGGPKGQDPWGSNNGGPPELDQLLRQLKKKLEGLFGGGSGGPRFPSAAPQPSGSGSGSGFGAPGIGLGAIAVGLFVLYVLSGVYLVQPAERAVVTQLGAYQKTVGPGPHWIPRFFQSKRVLDVDEVMTTQHGGMMLTQDENIVNVKLAVQYQIGDPKDYLFNTVDPQASLRNVVDSAIRYVIGHSTLDQILTSGRTLIAAQIKEQIIQNLEMYHAGLIISAVAMQEAEAPEEVKAAFLDAIRAREDEERLVNQAEAYAARIEPIARGHATRLLEDAKAYKSQVVLLSKGETERFDALLVEYDRGSTVMRDRLYLGTMEDVLSSTTKIVVDTTKGNNFLYLPLDKMSAGKEKTAVIDEEDLVAQAAAAAMAQVTANTTAPNVSAQPQVVAPRSNTRPVRGERS